jgi:RNA polymerase sigma factor (sigma-70 family)
MPPEHSEDDLEAQVDSGQLSEERALRQLEGAPKRPRELYDINQAHEDYTAGRLSEEKFWHSLLRFVEYTVQKASSKYLHFANIEDAITESTLSLWQRLREYDPKRSSFRTFATVVTLNKVRDLIRRQRASLGGYQHIGLEQAETMGLEAPGLSAEEKLAYDEWLKNMDGVDRSIVRMLKGGLTHLEIGEQLGISQQAVSKRLGNLKKNGRKPF